jgi:transcriptional regulator with PAS, ATPase and Fis domain
MRELEKNSIKNSLERNKGKRRKTAQELGISERTLYRKIREYGL